MSGNLAEALPVIPDNDLSPLVVDLDGTLIRSDLLIESFLALIRKSPWQAIKSLRLLTQGRAAFKNEIARHAAIDCASLPYNTEILQWLKNEKQNGRDIYLASASNEYYVRQIAEHLGLFADIFASSAAVNLKGKTKADILAAKFGIGGFDYAGNDRADIAVWERAENVIAVNAPGPLEKEIRWRFPKAKILDKPTADWRDYVRALRPHQWLKNLLVFVPAFMAHRYDAANGIWCLLGFISFSLCASSAYIMNDLLDLRHDRQHTYKRHRPFAAGSLKLQHAPVLLALCIALSLAVAAFLPARFLVALAAYFALTLAYSLYMKQKMIADVVTLALLYCARLVAGAAAVAIPLSPWLLSFSAFLFLCLALVKRCSEIVGHKNKSDPGGRGYRLADLPILECMASSSGYVAALTSGLYISSSIVTQLYGQPERLWAIPVILVFWVSRILLLTHRGEMHDDPVIFAMRDRTSLLCGTVMALVVLASI